MLLEAGHSQLQFLCWAQRWTQRCWPQRLLVRAWSGWLKFVPAPALGFPCSPWMAQVGKSRLAPKLRALSLVLARQETPPASNSATVRPWRRAPVLEAPSSALLSQLQAPCWEAQR